MARIAIRNQLRLLDFVFLNKFTAESDLVGWFHVIGIENVWNKFLLSPLELRDFIDRAKSEYVGSYFDVGNVLVTGYPEHWIEILGARIKAVHVKNFTREDCGGGLHGFGDDLMQGDIDWPALAMALRNIGYSGPLTAEIIPFSRLPNLVLPDMALARSTAKAMLELRELRGHITE